MREETYRAIFENEQNHWWYRVRRKMARQLIDTYFHPNTTSKPRILDVGCGTGGLLKELTTLGEVSGVDMSVEAIQFCKQNGLTQVTQASVVALPFTDRHFDIVLALDVLEHVENDGQAISEIMRVLRPGGIVIVFVPAFKLLWGKTDEVSEHKRRYLKDELCSLLSTTDAKLERISYFNSILFLPILLLRTLNRIINAPLTDEYRPGVGIANRLLEKIFGIELTLIRYINFPFGVSLMAVCRKL